MRKVLFLVLLVIIGMGAKAQFPTTDSLRNYNTRFTTNSAINWFTNLRGQTLLRGIIDHIDSASAAGGIDTIYAVNDSTVRYTKNGNSYNVIVRGSGGSAGFDTLYIKKAGTGTALHFVDGDSLKIKALQAGSNITLTQNADSSITIAASGGGGSQTFQQVLTTGRTVTSLDSISNGGYPFKFKGHLLSDSTIYAAYQVLGPTPTTVYTMHPLTGKNVIGKILPTYGTYAYPESGYGNEGGGYPGVWMSGQQALRFGWDGTGTVSLIQGFGTNRLSIQSNGTITSIATNNRFEFEGTSTAAPFVTFTGYQAATANTWPILFMSDPTTPNTAIGAVGREGEIPFAIYNSSYRQKSAFNFRGYLSIGDTSNITAGLTIKAPTVTRGIPAIRLYDSTFATNYWEISTPYQYSNTDLNFSFNGTKLFGGTANGAFFIGAHDPGFNRLSIKGIGSTSSTYSIYAQNSSSSFLFGVRDDGETYIGSSTDNGAFTLQNTGGFYQSGTFRLGGTNTAISTDTKLLVTGSSDSVVRQSALKTVNGNSLLGSGDIATATSTEGTYTVTLTNTTNIASSSTNTTYYQRVGDVVHVWGEFTATASATGVCEMGFSIPVSSAMSNSYDGAGTGSSDAYSVRIYADATNDRMTFRWTAPNTSATTHAFHFTYKYIAP